MSQTKDNLNLQEDMLRRAKAGDKEAIKWNRDLIIRFAKAAPVEDMLDIADYITDFLRRHIKNHLRNN